MDITMFLGKLQHFRVSLILFFQSLYAVQPELLCLPVLKNVNLHLPGFPVFVLVKIYSTSDLIYFSQFFYLQMLFTAIVGKPQQYFLSTCSQGELHQPCELP
jgi:hypothetical protein